MPSRTDYEWSGMSDERLAERLKEEEWRAKHKHKRVDRAIAKRNVWMIVKEQTRRYESKWEEKLRGD